MDRRRVIGLTAGVALMLTGGTVAAWPRDTPRAAAADGPGAPPPAVVEVAATPATAPPAARVKPRPAPRAGKRAPARSRDIALRPARGARDIALPKRSAERFSMVSLTWADPADAPAGAVEVRTRAADTGRWSGWRPLETAESRGPDRPAEAAGIRGGTGAIWVGAADGVEARLADGGAPLPAGLHLHLIDPGTPGGGGSGGQGGAAPAFPAYVSRAEWGADETMTRGAPAYADDVQVQFVHHTAGTNAYACADSPAILRGILLDHTRNRGWDDVGYNFLVDRCGTIFEGRGGGVDRAVIGAHTYGFNTRSSGIAVLGDHRTAAVPEAALSTIAAVAAAKLGAQSLDPAGTAQLTSGVSDGKFPRGTVVTFPRVAGHRDGVATECPGDALYARLGGVRATASAALAGLTTVPVTGGVAHGSTYYVRDRATLGWAVTAAEADLAGFDVLVDGRVAGSLAATARAAAVALAPGTRRLQVRARLVSGGSATSAAQTVVAKTAPPSFPRPATLALRTGQVSTTATPVTLGWQATDPVRLASVALTAPAARAFTTTTATYATTATPGRATTWTLAAKDLLGNTATSSVGRTPVLVAETAASRTGRWATKTGSASSYLGSRSLLSTARGAKLTYTYTGRAFGLVVTRTPTSGKADVHVNGRRVGTLDLKAATAYRQVVYVRATSATAARTTVQIVNHATTGRPGIIMDGLVYLK